MIRLQRILTLLISITIVITVFAQQMPGQWTIYPVIGKQYDKIIDGKDKVYFLTSSSIYSYDKENDETYFYDSSNKLSGSDVTDLFYNYEKGYLVIVYSDSNMDLLTDEGDCYALPEIKDANMTDDKTVNDIAFGDNRIYVATNFGLVIYDDNKKEVVESGIYRSPIEAVAVSGNNIVISNSGKLLFSPVSERHNSLQKFKEIAKAETKDMSALDNNIIVYKNSDNNTLDIATIDFDNSNSTIERTGVKVDGSLSDYKNGFFFRFGSNMRIYDNNAALVDWFAIPSDLSGKTFSFYDSKKSVWVGGEEGSANFDFTASQPVVLSDWYRPESVTCKEVVVMKASDDGKRIYLSNWGPTIIRNYLSDLPDGLSIRQSTNVIEDNKISDVSIVDASMRLSTTKSYQNIFRNKAMYGGITMIAPHPTQEHVYAVGNGQEGVFIVDGNEEVAHFDVTNAPFISYWNTRVFDVNYDPEGNLWVALGHFDTNYPPYIVLPADKMKKGYDNIKNEDWVWSKLTGMNAGSKDFVSFFAKKSNLAFFTHYSNKGIHIIDTKGTYANMDDDVVHYYSSMIDQDGNSITPNFIGNFTEDKEGRIWIGTNQGLVYIPNTSAIGETLSVIRPKVPRNDGTNYADFLLDSEFINDISVDPSDRKWIATDFSGVYLVSPDGDKILKHFDTSNSPLPSNRVLSVCADPLSNTVYFGNLNGLLSFRSDASPAMDDYSEVYAYPNPVKPDYTGWITVAGLMDNSLVKIADAAGNVLFQGRSEGGMISWDGCNSSGDRVKSGVYYVYASTGGDGQTANAVVTKIMVIR